MVPDESTGRASAGEAEADGVFNVFPFKPGCPQTQEHPRPLAFLEA